MNYPFPNANPFTGQANPYGGSSLFTAPVSAPSLGGNPVISMLLPIIAPKMMSPGSIWGGFGGTQNLMDVQRAMQFQRDLLAAGTTADAITSEELNRLARGMVQLTQETPLSDAQKTHIRAATNNLGSIIGFGAPVLEQFAPGTIDVLDMMNLGQRVASNTLMVSGRAQRDPIAGGFGLKPETIQQQLGYFNNRFYGESGQPDLMQGYGIGRLASFIDVGRRAGIAPGQQLSDASIRRLRSGMELADAITDEERQRIGTEGVAILKEGLGGSRVDEAVRRVDAMKLAKYGENMAGLMRAMEDLFGPGQPVEEAIKIAHALTQSGLSRMSLSQMESAIRRMDATSSITGVGIQQMANLQAVSAQMAAAGGVPQELGLGGGMYAAAAGKALEGRFQGSGSTKEEIMQKSAMLYGSAAASMVGNQFAATSRIGAMFKFKAGSEAEAMQRAIQRGQSTYTWKGKEKQLYMQNQSEWGRIMAEGTESEFDEAAAARVLTENRQNATFLGERGVLAAKRSQFAVDIAPVLEQEVMQATGRGAAASKDLTQKVWKTVTSFVPDSDKDKGQNMVKLRDEIQSQLEAAGVKNSKIAAFNILQGVNRTADLFGQQDAIQFGLLQGASETTAFKEAMLGADAKAMLDKSMSGLGRAAWQGRLAEAIKNAKPGTTFADVMKDAGNVFEKEDVEKKIAETEQQIINSRDYTPQQKSIMLKELQRQRGKIGDFMKADEAAIEAAEKAIKEAGAEGKIDLSGVERAKIDAAGAVASADLSGRGGRMELSGTLTIKEDGTATIAGVATSGQEGHTPTVTA